MNWHAKSTELVKNLETRLFVGGEYVEGSSQFESINPATGQFLAKISEADAKAVNDAVNVAKKCFASGVWRNLEVEKRSEILRKFADLIMDHKETLGLLETLDCGKPVSDSLRIDVPLTAQCVTWYAEAVDKLLDEVVPSQSGTTATVTREPLGVVAAIVPWNFPLLMAAWKMGPALALGNSVIIKPAEQTSLSAIYLGKLAKEAGIPDGVLQILPGRGQVTGKELALHPDVDVIGFTGSTEVGKQLLRYSADSNLKRVHLECGGKSPQVVFDDYTDIKKLANTVAWGIFFNQGEVCHAGSRLIVHEKIHDKLVQCLQEETSGFQPADPLLPDTVMGALISRSHLEKVDQFVKQAEKDGARIVCGGKVAREESGGFYYEPTVVTDVKPSMSIARDEVFGPVLSVLTFRSEDEAIDLANDSCYGLAGAVWSSDIGRAQRVAQKIRAGSVWINTFDESSIRTPFGGFKQSGFGRDKSLHSFEKYCDLKMTWWRWS